MHYYDRDGRPINLAEWVRLYTLDPTRRIRRDRLGRRLVSTVWLGLDHRESDGPPLIFETMIFPEQLLVGRWSTKALAVSGHEVAVRAVRRRSHGLTRQPARVVGHFTRARMRRYLGALGGAAGKAAPVKPSARRPGRRAHRRRSRR